MKKYKYSIWGIIGGSYEYHKNHPWTNNEWWNWQKPNKNLQYYLTNSLHTLDSSVLNKVDKRYVKTLESELE